MGNRYNAFISYRHSALDSRVAAAIQRDLEHFHIPGALRKRFGLQKINRIFRDKEELPITSDLNEDIAEALASSDFLIVICSPRTKESIWVEKEIETFLKTHNRHQVLTVLAEGEPGDVIPDILLSETVTDPKNGETHSVLVEPLSCDYRLPKGKARREELPRLAAALIGCKYDDLRQRQRLYRARQLAAVLGTALALAVAFTGYALRTGMQIQANYEQAQKNQSRYLSAEAFQAMENGDRLSAIALALEALPDEGRERPLTAGAELALAEAMRVYYAGSQIRDVGAYTPEHPVRTFFMSDDGKYLCTQDSKYVLDFWNVETYQKLWSAQVEFGLENDDLCFLDEERVLFIDAEGGLVCCSAETGDEVWRLYYGKYKSFSKFQCNASRDILLADCMGEVYRIDPDNGNILWTAPINPASEDNRERSGPYFLGEDSFSPDGTQAVLYLTSGGWLEKVYSLLYLDLENGAFRYSEQTLPSLWDACFTQNGNVVLLAIPDIFGERGTFYEEFEFSTSEETAHTVLCLDPKADQLLWENTQLVFNQGYGNYLHCCQDGNLFLATAELCVRIDARTGRTLGQCRLPASILRAYQDWDKARIFLEDGSVGAFRYDDFTFTSIKYFVEPLAEGRYASNLEENSAQYFVSQRNGASVIRYTTRPNTYSIEFSGQEADRFESVGDGLYDGHQAVVQSGWEQDRVYLLDMESHELRLAADLTRHEVRGRTALYFSADEGQYVFELMDKIYRLDLRTEELTEMQLPVPEGAYPGSDLYCDNGMLWYLASGYHAQEQEKVYLCRYNLKTEKMESAQWFLPDGSYYLRQAGPRWVVFDYDSGAAWLLSWEDGSIVPLEQAVTKDSSLAWNTEKDLLAIASGSSIFLVDADGTLLRHIEADSKIQVLDFPGELLVLDDSLQLTRYSPEGEALGTTLVYGPQHLDLVDIRWEYLENGKVLLYLGSNLNIIRPEENAVCTFVRDCLIYNEELNLFLCWEAYSKPMTFDYFTVEQLTQMGRETLGSFRLADPDQYGIEPSN